MDPDNPSNYIRPDDDFVKPAPKTAQIADVAPSSSKPFVFKIKEKSEPTKVHEAFEEEEEVKKKKSLVPETTLESTPETSPPQVRV